MMLHKDTEQGLHYDIGKGNIDVLHYFSKKVTQDAALGQRIGQHQYVTLGHISG